MQHKKYYEFPGILQSTIGIILCFAEHYWAGFTLLCAGIIRKIKVRPIP
jgi:hypothetical protein